MYTHDNVKLLKQDNEIYIVTDKNTDHGAKSLVGDPFNLK